VAFCVSVANSGESTHRVSVRVLLGSDVTVAAGVAALAVSVTVALGLYDTAAAPAVVGAAVTVVALQVYVRVPVATAGQFRPVTAAMDAGVVAGHT
jgi:hypothetical protein